MKAGRFSTSGCVSASREIIYRRDRRERRGLQRKQDVPGPRRARR